MQTKLLEYAPSHGGGRERFGTLHRKVLGNRQLRETVNSFKSLETAFYSSSVSSSMLSASAISLCRYP